MTLRGAATLSLLLLLPAAARAQDGSAIGKFKKSQAAPGAPGAPAGGPAAPPGFCAPDTSPAPSGPSDPVGKAAVLAAIKEYADRNRGTATAWLAKGFPAVPVIGGPDAAFHEGYVALVADQLRQMVEKDMIVVTALPSSVSASADWGQWINSDGFLGGGEVRLTGLNRVTKLGAGASRCGDLLAQDMFADSVLHETAHMFHAALTCWFGAKATLSGVSVRSKFRWTQYWKGSALSFCTGQQCANCGINDDGVYTVDYQGPHATRGDANEYLAREISNAMCLTADCAAHERVLKAAFAAAGP